MANSRRRLSAWRGAMRALTYALIATPVPKPSHSQRLTLLTLRGGGRGARGRARVKAARLARPGDGASRDG